MKALSDIDLNSPINDNGLNNELSVLSDSDIKNVSGGFLPAAIALGILFAFTIGIRRPY